MPLAKYEDLPFNARPDLTPYLLHLTKLSHRKSAYDNLVSILRDGEIPDEAHVQMFDDALAALTGDNRRRAQHFAVTLRELFAHTLSSRVSDAEVEKCAWYVREEGTQGPTRKQRALYLSRGGLRDEFIREILKLDPSDFHQELSKAFKELSTYSHVRPNHAPTEPDKIEEFANLAIGAFDEVFDVIEEVRHAIEDAIESDLQNEAASVFIQETIDKLDIIAGSYTTEGVLFHETGVTEIGAEFISYRATGTVEVELHYGGRSDSVQIEKNFPFTCTIVAKIDKPYTFLDDMTKMEVDTRSWHGDLGHAE